ncbi:MAG: iron-containing alcohol dehydrogenase [Acutalibacteraceae bacterium]
MKAVIFNSGLGKRMGSLTEHNHKSMVKLQNGETIFERQLRLLHECGINQFIVTVGPFKEQLIEASKAKHLSDCEFIFVENPIYDKTNYIYSMYLARDYIDDDVLMLHGDLVFNKKLARDIIDSEYPSLGCVNKSKALPEKDFKARIIDRCVHEVSINIFDKNCFAFQPFYKLTKADVSAWLAQVVKFIEAGQDQCYAENAMNEIFGKLSVKAFGYENYYVDEVDNAEDLARVSADIRRFDFAEQECYDSVSVVKNILSQYRIKNPMLICGIPVETIKPQLDFDFVLFDKVRPNPLYEDVCKAVEVFRNNGCDGIISIGGGSASDTAKCVKLYSAMTDSSLPYIEQEFKFSPIKHIAIPTTAGTGSESTRFAVMYYNGEKQSVTHDSILPDVAVLDSSLLKSLPEYQKKSTLLDALCQGIESMWSVNSDEISKSYAEKSVKIILANYRGYLEGNQNCACQIMLASNLAGRAINITQTTAAHAMSYKITSIFGISHGHAVALCLPEIWRYIAKNTDKCIDKRGAEYLNDTLEVLSSLFGGVNSIDGADIFERLFDELNMPNPTCCDYDTLETLAKSVNPVRLSNNPVKPEYDVLLEMYTEILK